jgi:tetratricopeptide (TPR) repeat protein
MAKDVESLVRAGKWAAAEKQIRRELKSEPGSHWLWTRLSVVRYERHAYSDALKYAKKALKIMPTCSLALWDRAGALDMLKRHREAIRDYKMLVVRGTRGMLREACNESRGWARGLVADSHYRLGLCWKKLGRKAPAREAIRKSLRARGPGCRSIYPVSEVRQALRLLESS